MATIKSYTDLEQSKKLAKILPLESADYHYITQGEKSYFYPYSLLSDAIKDYDEEIKYIPCWSLGALIDIMPKSIIIYGNIIKEYKWHITTRCVYYKLDNSISTLGYTQFSYGEKYKFKTLIDAVYNMLVWLFENNYIKK